MSSPAADEAAASSSSSSVPESQPTRPYTVKRYCLCKKEIDMTKVLRCKCSKCKWNFCNKDCRKQFKKEHKVNCEVNRVFNCFYDANKNFFCIFGAWLKSRDDVDYVGMRIDIADDPAAEVKATPFNKQSYDILLQQVHGVPDMYKAGYPDCFAIMISWKGQMICCELDLVRPTRPDHVKQDMSNNGSIMLGDSPLFDHRNAGLFIVPPAAALKNEKRNGWMESFQKNKERPAVMVPRVYNGFKMWKELEKLKKQ